MNELETIKKPRIKKGTKFYGMGDDLTSNFINGNRLPKHSPAHKVYSHISHTKNTLCYFLAKYDKDTTFLESFDNYVFNYLKDNLHSLGSFCFLWGSDEAKKHIFPKTLLTALEDRIDYFQNTEINDKCLEDCQDFLTHDDIRFIRLDHLNNHFRDLEIAYAAWHFELFGISKPVNSRKDTAALLNRLSTYIFNMTRYYSLKFNVEECYWKAEISEFIPPDYETK